MCRSPFSVFIVWRSDWDRYVGNRRSACVGYTLGFRSLHTDVFRACVCVCVCVNEAFRTWCDGQCSPFYFIQNTLRILFVCCVPSQRYFCQCFELVSLRAHNLCMWFTQTTKRASERKRKRANVLTHTIARTETRAHSFIHPLTRTHAQTHIRKRHKDQRRGSHKHSTLNLPTYN